MALTAAHTFKAWRRLLLLVTVFTMGHTIALILSVFKLLNILESLVEFLIPITILITAVLNFLSTKKSFKKGNIITVALLTLFFGVIHGLGFSNYFKTILPGNTAEKVLPLFEFSLGIEAAQITVVLSILLMSYVAQTLFKVSQKDFTIVVSAFIVGVVTPMIIENQFWNTF
jgi:hypothetical protein